jgi:amidase
MSFTKNPYLRGALGASALFALLCATVSVLGGGGTGGARSAGGEVAAPAGVWEVTTTWGGERFTDRFVFEAHGEKLAGKGKLLRLGWGGLAIEGTLREGAIAFTLKSPKGQLIASFTGTLAGEAMSGTLRADGLDATWSAARPAPPAAARLHPFAPERFSHEFSGAVPPVLRVASGDSIATTCVDAHGTDEASVHRTLPGNPLTGPFYVEGALPGDSIAVHLDRLRLNRDWAFSGSTLSVNALLPAYVQKNKPLPDQDDPWKVEWRLDREQGIAYLSAPSEGLRDFYVPLRPMLGCIGVAPPNGQAVPTANLGAFGGNLDFRGIREGTTVYLPVFQPGALLFVGDGHALEGDGELTTNALETSVAVELTITVRHEGVSGPRVEDDDALMTLGIGASLPDALQHATTELAGWIEHLYDVTPGDVALVLGTSLEYEVAEVVDPQFDVVAKIEKETLSRLRPRRTEGR